MKKLVAKLALLKTYSLPFTLRKHERFIITCGALAVGLLMVLQFVIFPIFDQRAALRKRVKANMLNLQAMQSMQAEMQAVSASTNTTQQQLQRRPEGFTLFSFLDRLAGATDVKQNIVYMKPSNSKLKNSSYVLSIVEMKLQSLSMEQLVNFLHGVENSAQHIWVKRMSINKGDKDEGLLTSVLQVETFQL